MKCISVWQPWADLIVHGLKDIENREWPTEHRGPILIHAGERFVEDHGLDSRRLRGGDREIVEASRERLGRIVGVAAITDCVTIHPSPWFFGPYGFVLSEARRFCVPIPWPVQRRLFDVPDKIIINQTLVDRPLGGVD